MQIPSVFAEARARECTGQGQTATINQQQKKLLFLQNFFETFYSFFPFFFCKRRKRFNIVFANRNSDLHTAGTSNLMNE